MHGFWLVRHGKCLFGIINFLYIFRLRPCIPCLVREKRVLMYSYAHKSCVKWLKVSHLRDFYKPMIKAPVVLASQHILGVFYLNVLQDYWAWLYTFEWWEHLQLCLLSVKLIVLYIIFSLRLALFCYVLYVLPYSYLSPIYLLLVSTNLWLACGGISSVQPRQQDNYIFSPLTDKVRSARSD